jgi:Flp pilus assembly protein TadG
MRLTGKLRRNEQGQGLVEFAMLLPLLMLLMLGAIDFGRAMYAAVAVNHAGHNSAVWASQNLRFGTAGTPSCGSATAYCCPTNNNTASPDLAVPSSIREVALRDFSGGFEFTASCPSTTSSLGSTCNPQVSCSTGTDAYYSGSAGTQHRYVEVTARYRFTAIGPYGPWVGSTDITRTARVRRVP